MATKTEKLTEKLAKGIVDEMYTMFQDSKNRGENFTWERFPKMMKSMAEAYAPATFYTLSGEKLAKAEAAVGELAYQLAKEKVAANNPP